MPLAPADLVATVTLRRAHLDFILHSKPEVAKRFVLGLIDGLEGATREKNRGDKHDTWRAGVRIGRKARKDSGR